MTTSPPPGAVSYPARLRALAAKAPDRPAVVLVRRDGAEDVLSRSELLERAEALAWTLRARGAGPGDFVVITLPNSLEPVIAAYATWIVGACVLPLDPRLAPRERDELLQLIGPRVVVEDRSSQTEGPARRAAGRAPAALPDVVARPGKAIASGGSTGRPKVIVDQRPWARVPGDDGSPALARLLPDTVQLVTGGLYHNTPFGWCHQGLFAGQTVVLMEKFDAAQALHVISAHSVSFAALVPTMMGRIARLPEFGSADLSSLDQVLHTASSCPAWVKHAWISALGPERLVEAYGATDYIGACVIRGDEWLERPGSVGRPLDCDVLVLDDDGRALPPGEVGVVHMRLSTSTPAFSYIGAAPLATTHDGYATVGDLGWLDEDGYLYLADRRSDLIVTGGANVYPAEVEGVLTEHPEVVDCAVVGVADDDWGRVVHALIQPRCVDAPPSVQELTEHCAQRLAAYKRPRGFEFVRELPRSDAGKLRRSALVTSTAQRSEERP